MPISAACVLGLAGLLATPDLPGVSVSRHGGRVSRVYGRPLATGETARQSAETFLAIDAGILGVEPGDLVAAGPGPDGRHVQPIMYDSGTGDFRFTGFFYTQQRGGVPVYGTALKLIVRNEPGYPLVLAAADLRALGAFRVNAHAPAPAATSRRVIWAGTTNDMGVQPRLADETLVVAGEDKSRVITDAMTGVVLHRESLIHTADVTGVAGAIATTGPAAEHCEGVAAMPLNHLVVEIFGLGSGETDENGAFVIPNAGPNLEFNVFAFLNGRWFDVDNDQGSNAFQTATVTPPAPAVLLFNAANTEHARAEVNAFIHANRIRDFVLEFNPAYPLLDNEAFPISVNRDDFICPGNAWYDSSGGGVLNFCESDGSDPNTAYSAVIYHEYGHHLVHAGGSGQCQYGEGVGDAMSVLMLDDPDIALGIHGGCLTPLRTADIDCQYDETNCTTNCGGPCHACGRLLSSSVWSTRNQLAVTHPADYTGILGGLVVNSILVHVGTEITPDIVIDLLVLDDDDADLCNGTPHSAEITAGFGEHGLFADISGCVPGDVDGDGTVGILDFLILLGAWGPCGMPCPPSCPADIDGNCAVGINDMLLLLANWS